MTLPMPSKGWRLALIAACVIAPFVWSSWYLTSGIAEVRRADDVVQSAEAARAEINRLAALENAAGAGTTVFWSDVDEAVAGLRADNDVVIEMLPPADRADFDRTIDEYVTAVVETIREYLDGRIADGDVIDSERTEPLYSSLVDWIGLVRDDAVAASSDARRDADRGLQLGAIGVLASLSLFAFLIAGEHGRSRAKRAERSASARFRTLIEDSSDHIYVIDDDQKILFMSPAAQRAMGGEFTSASDLVAALGEEIQQVVFRLLKRPDGATEEILLHLDGRSEWYEVRVTDGTDRPEVGGVVIVARDITKEVRLRDRLMDQAMVDDLTRLPNRRAIRMALAGAAARSARHDADATLVLIDLDGFKGVNDTLGHPVGDELLRQVARRLEGVMRSGEVVGRLGGDEFAAVIEHADGTDGITAFAARLLESLEQPFEVGTHLLSISASLGAVPGGPGVDPDEMFRKADIALYEAKHAGRRRLAVFESSMEDRLLLTNQLENQLQVAMERGEFRLEYQPILAAGPERVIGYEALMRWHSPVLGRVSPLTFIPVTEQIGIIVELGRWALEEACQQLADWHQLTGDPTLTMSVNVSVVQLEQDGFVGHVLDAIETSGIDSSCLQLEVTESVVVSDSASVMNALSELRTVGVTVALDDFGTGYSSMSQLRSLPVDCLKIDRAFVKELGDAADRDLRVVEAMIELANAFDLVVIAEGVEQRRQLDLLVDAGCGFFQGYLFSPPVPPDEITATLSSLTRPA